ncbi:TerD family protein [Streptomyces nanshensis]|uniref:TerD-family protein n=1 Tax=Streptomyces nanshensis TaxID=518642 RepID=A0A1E7KZ58_9ACTN|nr:TerD family protein [Streptomyces nanshensis]OEV09161.1 TerD-family protein [Streptomyces nanshensis]
MSSLSKGLDKVEVTLKWDPSPMGAPTHDLDLVAATYTGADPYGDPAYLVHFDSRSPDGTITLNRDSRDGQGFGPDEAMTLELERLSPDYVRVVVGVAIQQGGGRITFGDVASTLVELAEGYDKLAEDDFAGVAGATAATVAEFVRTEAGAWELREGVTGFDTEPEFFAQEMGRRQS